MCHEAYMMSAPCQSYITRCSGTVVTPRATLDLLEIAVDTDSSLHLATVDLLHNVRKCSGRKVKTLAGYVQIQSIGELVIPHCIVGSVIVEATVVTKDILPGGTRVTLGRSAINATYLDPTALVDVAPSLVSPATFKTKPVPSHITYDYVVRDKNDAWHAVC